MDRSFLKTHESSRSDRVYHQVRDIMCLNRDLILACQVHLPRASESPPPVFALRFRDFSDVTISDMILIFCTFCSTAMTNIPFKIALSCLPLLQSVIKSRRDSESIYFALITCSDTCSRISHRVKSIACLSSSVQRILHHHCSRHFILVWPLSAVIYNTNILQSRHLPYKYTRKPSFTAQMHSQAVIHRTNVLPSSHLPYKCISKPSLTAKMYSQTVIYK